MGFRTDRQESIEQTARHWPIIAPAIHASGYHQIEGSNHATDMLLDRKSGIDIIAQTNAGLVTIAMRWQPDTGFRTFTIRSRRPSGAETELSKRLISFRAGTLMPTYQFQGYYDADGLSAAAFIRMTDLCQFLENKQQCAEWLGKHTRMASNGGQQFQWVDWQRDVSDFVIIVELNERPKPNALIKQAEARYQLVLPF